jgi:hypothetical protein
MIATRTNLAVMAAAVLWSAALSGQVPATAPLPTFAGTWAPSDPERSDRFFAVGLTAIPGDGQLTIEQGPDRLTLSITMPDEKLDPLLNVTGRFYRTIVYRVPGERVRLGGFGAGGPQFPAGPHWLGDQLVLPDVRPAARPITAILSIDGERLKMETHVELRDGRTNTVTEWFTRIR